MKYIFVFFIFYLASAYLVTNRTVEIYYDTEGDVYLSYEQGYVNKILNPEKFHLSAGYGKVTFDIKNHNINLLHYFPQSIPKVKLEDTSYSPMFIKTIYVGIFRGANRDDTSKCVPIAKAREYVRYTDLNQRLWSGNQVRISQGNDLYISSKCLIIDESIYESAVHQDINNALYAAAEKIDKIPKIAVRWYINDDYKAGWLGLAAVGSPSVVTNPDSTYWLICKINRDVEDPTNSKLLTIVHEFGHSCGLGHGGLQYASVSGTFTSFSAVDNYDDSANYMGVYATWEHPITASQYYQVIVGGKPEPWLFKNAEEGVHKYRLYSIDHPYTRHFLGTNKAFHNESEVFDGIKFGYNCMAIRILVNESLTSKYTGAAGTSGSLMLEYRFDPTGQKGSQEFGVRVTYGFDPRGNFIQGNLDHLRSWGDSEITIGVDYYPVDFDNGTFRVRVTKIHKVVLEGKIEDEIVKDDKRNYDEAGYAELEIEFYPKKKYTPGTIKGIPNLVFSPSYFNCFSFDTSDEIGYNCSKTTTNSGWYYFINNGNRDRNIPRVYTQKNEFIRARSSLRSYNGLDYSTSKVCYGDNGGIKCFNVTINAVSFSGVSRKTFNNAEVTRIKIGDVNQTVEDLGINNVIFGSGIEVPEGGRAYITDLFGNERSIKIIDKTFSEILPTLETDGFAEGAVVVKDKNGEVTYYNGFTIYQPENGNRVAVEFNDNGKFEVSPAVMPSNTYFTTTSMLYPITIKANNWFYYPVQHLDYYDYILVDFRGNVPKGLKITVETDMGEYSRDLSDLGGLNSVSYKLTFKEMNKATGGWGDTYRYKFNKDVEIQNIRPIYKSKVGNQITEINAVNEEYTFDGYRYKIESSKIEAKYIYKKVSVEMNGNKFSFDTPTSKSTSVDIKKKGLSTFLVVLIIIAVVVVLIGLIFIVIKCKSKNKGSSRTYSANAYSSNRPAYPAALGRTAPPPMVGYAPRGTMPPGGAGYAGGYAPRGTMPPGGGGYAGGYAGGYRR